jgi:hypothetical protein
LWHREYQSFGWACCLYLQNRSEEVGYDQVI